MGSVLEARFRKSSFEQSGDQSEQANLLAGDAIINYRTIASFGNEEAIVLKYEEMLNKTLDG